MTDIVLSFFARPGPGQVSPSVAQPTEGFTSPVEIANGPFQSGESSNAAGFRLAIQKLRNPKSGRILPNLLRSLGLRPEGGKIAVVGFSAGRAGVQELLSSEQDRDAIDTVIDLDGLHLIKNPSGTWAEPQSLLPWTRYGILALDGAHMLILAHTGIASPNLAVYSTTESSQIVFQTLAGAAPLVPVSIAQNVDLSKLSSGPPPPSVTIAGQAGDVTRTYEAHPSYQVSNVGNAWQIAMPGTHAGDHIFMAYYTQGAIWRTFLQPRWNAGQGCIVSAPGFAPRNSYPPVTLYSLQGCGACTLAKQYLRSKGVSFVEKDYAREDVQQEMDQQGLPKGEVPVIVIGSRVIRGFQKPLINNALFQTCPGPKPVTQESLDEDVALDGRWKRDLTATGPLLLGSLALGAGLWLAYRSGR